MDPSTSEHQSGDDAYVDVTEPIKAATPPTSSAGGGATPTFPLEHQEGSSGGKNAENLQPPAGLKNPSQMRYLTRVTDVIYGEVSTQDRLAALPKSSTELDLQPDDPPPLYPRTVSMVGSWQRNVAGGTRSSSLPRCRAQALRKSRFNSRSLQPSKQLFDTEPAASTSATGDINVVGKGSCNLKTTPAVVDAGFLNEEIPATALNQSSQNEAVELTSSEENCPNLTNTHLRLKYIGKSTDHEREDNIVGEMCADPAVTEEELGNLSRRIRRPSASVHSECSMQKLAEELENATFMEPSASDSDSSTDYEELIIYKELADHNDCEDIDKARNDALGLPKTIRHRTKRIVKDTEGPLQSVTVSNKTDRPSGTLEADSVTKPETAVHPKNHSGRMIQTQMSHDKARQVLDMMLEANNVRRASEPTARKMTATAECSTLGTVALPPEVAKYQKHGLLLSKSPSEVAKEIRFLTASAPEGPPPLPGVQRSRAKVVAQSDDVVRKRKILQKTKTFPAYEQTAMHNELS